MLVVNEKRLVKHRNSFSTVWTHSLEGMTGENTLRSDQPRIYQHPA